MKIDGAAFANFEQTIVNVIVDGEAHFGIPLNAEAMIPELLREWMAAGNMPVSFEARVSQLERDMGRIAEALPEAG